MTIWGLGAKVPDIDAEIAVIRAMGGRLVLDERISVDGREHRIPLLQLADKYLHIAPRMVYEDDLDAPLGDGLCHMVVQVGDLAEARDRALRAGALEVRPATRVVAGFGTRYVAFFRTPGGILIELAEILSRGVPDPS